MGKKQKEDIQANRSYFVEWEQVISSVREITLKY